MSKKASIIVSDGVKNVARVVDANSAVKIKAKSGVKYLLKGEHDDEAPENVTVTLLGTAQADLNGNWSFTPPDDLKDGAHNITATATDAIGRTSDATGIWNFAVDTAKPEAVGDLVVTDDVGTKTGPLEGGDTTDDAAPMHIDLSALGLQGVEKFDLGTGGNTLTLGAKDVLANGQTDLALADGKKQMVVNGANGEVDLLGGDAGADGWASEGATEVAGVTYNVYTNLAGTTELLIENKVQVTIL